MYHLTEGLLKSQSRTLSQRLYQSMVSAILAQKPSGSSTLSLYSLSYSSKLFMCAFLEKSSGGVNSLTSWERTSMVSSHLSLSSSAKAPSLFLGDFLRKVPPEKVILTLLSSQAWPGETGRTCI